MLVLAVADKALDIIGLGTVIYWTIKATRWSMRRFGSSTKPPARPRAVNLNDDT